MLGLTVYADESGIHDKHGLLRGSEVTAVAGYLASRQSWNILSRRWRTALDKYEIETFHMSKYWREEPPYDKWSSDKRKRFLKTLIKIARDNTWFAIGGMVPTREYDQLLPEQIREGLGELSFDHPYHFCFAMLFARFLEYLRKDIDNRFPRNPGFEEKVAFVFDQQKEFEELAKRGFNVIKKVGDPQGRLGPLTFAASKDYEPLQAADLLAFYARRILTHQLEGKVARPVRGNVRRAAQLDAALLYGRATNGICAEICRASTGS
ncbi:DUF3800 domain-containing protein [Candidatus Binatus sp.]|uniref:DUF3800 domain-containing protein n=1 Tax=Candidatus Binatus sp. TaxID=2811406 RepID=UPI003BB09891